MARVRGGEEKEGEREGGEEEEEERDDDEAWEEEEANLSGGADGSKMAGGGRCREEGRPKVRKKSEPSSRRGRADVKVLGDVVVDEEEVEDEEWKHVVDDGEPFFRPNILVGLIDRRDTILRRVYLNRRLGAVFYF